MHGPLQFLYVSTKAEKALVKFQHPRLLPADYYPHHAALLLRHLVLLRARKSVCDATSDGTNLEDKHGFYRLLDAVRTVALHRPLVQSFQMGGKNL